MSVLLRLLRLITPFQRWLLLAAGLSFLTIAAAMQWLEQAQIIESQS